MERGRQSRTMTSLGEDLSNAKRCCGVTIMEGGEGVSREREGGRREGEGLLLIRPLCEVS